ncbi:PorT family protein [Flavobacterium sp. Fl-77]|uniref:PorT family protein n=1 Tax=Flavobacterium flavipigmentatum TaxID=2893884 RepID=A0AAJ2VWI7_9FLAO|nr:MULTISPECIES: PorT family protein [unclassified Flavobacterium]MDX6180584.1 PorT family protein [Flavobacterium sp. Fl-33]MDX6184184.1 PorT family protein [Flavobacterium sp. Fl-77]UFH39297.1 PorT family protein [Flavobacterium sp. F-70]
MKRNLLFIFLLCYAFANAQISFEKGYFISNDEIKTECFIKNIDWYNNPVDFSYKVDANDGNIKIQTIANVKEFGIENGATYKRANIKVDISSNKLENLSSIKNPIWRDEVAFLKVLVQGKASLYYYTNKDISRFFYETTNTPIEQLVYKEYLFTNNETDAKSIEENNYYKQQLYNNISNENTNLGEIKKLNYKTDQLVKYFLKYNNVDAKTIEKTLTSKKSIYLLKVTAGASSSSLTVNGAGGSYGFKDAEYDNKIGLKIGLEGEYILPFNKNKWSLFINLVYQKYEDTQEYGVVTGINNGVVFQYPSEVKYSGLQLPIGLRHYFFLNNNSKIFINAGYALNINGKFSLKSKPINIDGKSGGNILYGIGYDFKSKINAEIRVNANRNLLRYYNAFYTDYNTIDLMLSYTLL